MTGDSHSSLESSPRERLIRSIAAEVHEELTDSSEEEDEFVRRYGDIDYHYIERPKDAVWFIRPHALNFFKDGVLFRTKGERTSAKTEILLDLMYVGISANLAGEASENASWEALVKYILIFIPYWTIWADIKDFTNYYYNEDLSQKTYILWILILLTLSVNNHSGLLDSQTAAAFTIVPYILCRLSLAFSILFYSFYIPEHRIQQRVYFATLMVTCCLWVPVIFVNTTAKVVIAVVAIFLKHLSFCVVFLPWSTKTMNLSMSTTLNIEHEVERLATFVTIAIGEFLFKLTSSLSLGIGYTIAIRRGICMLVTAYTIFWIYYNGGTCDKAVHPLRHSAFRSITWIYMHVPIIGGIILAADAAGDLLNRELKYSTETLRGSLGSTIFISEDEPSLRALSFFFTGGICVALICIGVIGLLDKCEDQPGIFYISQFWRVFWRIPAGLLIVCLSIPNMDLTHLFDLVALVLVVLWVFEAIVSVPRMKET